MYVPSLTLIYLSLHEHERLKSSETCNNAFLKRQERRELTTGIREVSVQWLDLFRRCESRFHAGKHVSAHANVGLTRRLTPTARMPDTSMHVVSIANISLTYARIAQLSAFSRFFMRPMTRITAGLGGHLGSESFRAANYGICKSTLVRFPVS